MNEIIKKACTDLLTASTKIEKAYELHTDTIIALTAGGVDWSDLSKTLQAGYVSKGQWPTKLQYHRWAEAEKDNYTGDAPKDTQANEPVGVNKGAEMRNKAAVALNRFNAFKGKFQGIDENENLIPKGKPEPRQSKKAGQEAGQVADPKESKTSAGHVVDRDELYGKTLSLMLQEFEKNQDADGYALVHTLAEKVGVKLTEETTEDAA